MLLGMKLVGLAFHGILTMDDILGDKNVTFPKNLSSK